MTLVNKENFTKFSHLDGLKNNMQVIKHLLFKLF